MAIFAAINQPLKPERQDLWTCIPEAFQILNGLAWFHISEKLLNEQSRFHQSLFPFINTLCITESSELFLGFFLIFHRCSFINVPFFGVETVSFLLLPLLLCRLFNLILTDHWFLDRWSNISIVELVPNSLGQIPM